MKRRSMLCAAGALVAALALAPDGAAAAERIKVVASFSILADMVRNVGGDRVEVAALVGPDGDAHVYEPTPADARAVAEADLVVINGLGFEGFLERLVDASGYEGPVVVATEGVSPLAMGEEDEHGAGAAHHDGEGEGLHAEEEGGHEHPVVDPHAWQSLANAQAYVRNILAGLSAADPAGAGAYAANAEAYAGELAALDAWVRAELGALPPDRRTIVTSHDAFGYFAAAYGLRFVAPAGLSTDSEPSAAEVAALIRQIKAENIKAVFIENITNPKLIEQIGAETGAAVGGTLYSDALSRSGGPADTYVKMFRFNVGQLKGALS